MALSLNVIASSAFTAPTAVGKITSVNMAAFDSVGFAKTLPGVTEPLGFFDPLGFCAADGASNEEVTEGKVRFYREVELKHGRVAMLAALGFPLAEQVCTQPGSARVVG